MASSRRIGFLALLVLFWAASNSRPASAQTGPADPVGPSAVSGTADDPRSLTAPAEPASDAAESLRVRAQWHERGQCPTRSEVSERVQTLTGRQPFIADDSGTPTSGTPTSGAPTSGATDALMDVAYERAGQTFSAVVRVTRPDTSLVGVRRVHMETGDCALLLEPLSMVVALLVDLPRQEIELRVPEPVVASPWYLTVAFAGIGEAGRVGDVAFGGALRVSFLQRFLGLEAVVTFLQAEMQREEGSLRSVSFLLRLGPCLGTDPRQTFGMVGCGGIEGGTLRMQAFGFAELRDPRVTALVGPYLSLRGIWRPLAWLGLDLAATGGVPLVRDRFNVVNTDGTRQTLYQGLPVHGALEVSARVQLPL